MRSWYVTPAAAFSAAALLIAFGSAAHAGDFLIDPAGGTPLSVSNDDDGYAFGNTGFSSFTMLDSTRTSGSANGVPVVVTTNGFIHFRGVGETANFSPADAPFPTSGGVHRIAGAWDDYILRGPSPGNPAGDSIIESKGLNYYAVTYNVHKNEPGGGDSHFQIALFGGDVTIGGQMFKANDIVFSYGKMQSPPLNNNATIGLDAGNGVDFVVPPSELGGNTNGVFNSFADLIRYSPDNSGGNPNGFLRFAASPDGSGGVTYTPGVVVISGGGSSAPEPGSLALLGTGIFALGGVALRRRK